MILIQLIIPALLIILLLYLKRKFTWKLVKRYHSPISGQIDISKKYNGELVLMTNYFVQGVSIEQPSITKSYWYAVAEKILIHCENKKDTETLFIGLGANTSSLLINQNNPFIKLTIVEIDPLIVTVCKKFFHLNRLQNTDIIIDDIERVVVKKQRAWKIKFDCMVVDTFEANPPYLFHASHSPEFLRQLFPWLKKDGMIVFNIPVKTEGIAVPELLRYLRTLFKQVDSSIIEDPRGYRNYVITAAVKK